MVEETKQPKVAPPSLASLGPALDDERRRVLEAYRRKMIEYRDVETRLKTLRMEDRELEKKYEKSENDIKALQSVGQIVGEVLKQLTEDKCECAFLLR
jgi:ATP-dependent 26S proteasome regulatory subunit